MKVLFITNLPSPYRVRFFSELGNLCDLTVVYERRSASDRDSKWTAQAENTFKEVYLDAHEIGTDNSWSLGIIKYLNKSYDHIVIGMYSTVTAMIAIIYMKIKKIPFILSTDGGFVKEERKEKKMFKKFFINAADKWLSTGTTASEYLCHYGANKERISVYPFTSLSDEDILSKPISFEEKKNIKNKLGINEDRMILSVGQFIFRKGFDVLLKASQAFDNTIGVYIIGGGNNEEYINLCEKYNLSNVHFIEFMDKNELLEYYKAADLFVLPTREDIWGLVINEAMACGIPVITTNKCIAGQELIENGQNGYIVPVDNVDELNRKILCVLNDKVLQKNMSKKSLEMIRSYTFWNMAKIHMKIFEEESNHLFKENNNYK
ncbi:glycosyltransferase family 4 protein [Peribacillus frigoritolerans]|uniref:glycosyltransferase family 4 protein n=1 Tax=Peribacillus frigoritolerans TaxID=450367 RepID=UPI002B24652A|nr:glycosyltransferase family 4 protein [Peribacillus frigoritolerans]MEB2629676.1 glycosyltransferase family 4 protein [Peribacillus frigoritolerans]